jgi:hypothetical protein
LFHQPKSLLCLITSNLQCSDAELCLQKFEFPPQPQKMESKDQESKEDRVEAKGAASDAKGGDDSILVKVQNSDKIVLFEGEVDKNISLEQLANQYLPEAPGGQTYSLFEVTQ